MGKLLIVCGPTATGKTDLAVSLAKQFDGELISADSRQVYRGMDIGTGKDKDRIDVPIWLIDVVNPNEAFSVSHFVRLAKDAIQDIQHRGKRVIIVGGTGLYIHAMIHPIETANIPPDTTLRKTLETMSLRELQQMLPGVKMNNSDWNNPRRLVRKIEIQKAHSMTNEEAKQPDYLMVGLKAPMDVLQMRIRARVEARMRQGMKKEVAMIKRIYGDRIPALSAIGYRSLSTWEHDELSYAKRQMTWFKRYPEIQWFDVTDPTYRDRVTSYVFSWYTNHDS